MCTAAGLLWVLPSSGSLSAHHPVRGWAAGQCWPQSCTQAGSTARCCLAVLLFLQAVVQWLLCEQLSQHALQAGLSDGYGQPRLSKNNILLWAKAV